MFTFIFHHIFIKHYFIDEKVDLEWSAGVSVVNNNDLFIRVPYYGDVKFTIVNTACTTFLTIESVSQVSFSGKNWQLILLYCKCLFQVEISARDIRVRLSMREMESASVPAFQTNKESDVFNKVKMFDIIQIITLVSNSKNP